MKLKYFLLIVCLAATQVALDGCSANPATGRTQFAALMSPQQEEGVGAEEHPKIVAEYGLYDDPKVTSYVQSVGERVSRNTERPDVRYKYFVLDSPVVNAFALPGGYIYTTRGLLALANSEAELAAVLAHETGHITGRHSAERYSRGVVTSLGANILAAAIDQGAVTQALGLGSDLYLKSYSRSQEDEADTLGIRYLAQNGYAPEAMSKFLNSLQNSSALESRIEGGSGEGLSYFSTHPATADRVAKTSAEAAAVHKVGVMDKNRYFDVIDGITYGESARQGFVRGNSFIHPGIGFRFDAPPGFRIINQPQQVVATSPSGALILFDIVPNKAGQDALTYLTRSWMKGEAVNSPEPIVINGMNAASAAFSGSINNQPMTIRLVAVEFAPGSFARFQIVIPNNASSALVDDLKRTTYSLIRLSEQEKQSYKPYRLRLVTAGAGDTVASLARNMPDRDFPEDRFRVLNGLAPGETLIPGQRYKVIAAN